MGKVVEKKKKKKGRPSLLDLQKRSLRQQQEQQQQQQQKRNPNSNPYSNHVRNPIVPNPNPNPNPNRRFTRRNPCPDGTAVSSERNEGGDADVDEDDDDEPNGRRREKKLKFVLRLPAHQQQHNSSLNSGSYGSDSNAEDDNGETPHKRRKINAVFDGSGHSDAEKGAKSNFSSKGTGSLPGTQLETGPTTPLPDKKLLVFILDRLQKKDTYGVFSEPVDPEELPDYHEVIEHPMDFGTVRKKLDGGAYSNLEQFEKDVFLICSNAMTYNASDTIYFRQARSIQELAKKNFENLRQDSDDNEPEPKIVRRGRPPTKNLKKPQGRPSLERAGSEFSGATLASGGDGAMWSHSYDIKRGPPLDGSGPTDTSARAIQGSGSGEAYTSWLADHKTERNDEFSGLKGMSMKCGKKQFILDENRRNTYLQSHILVGGREPSVFTTFDGEKKLLMAVGLHSEHGYTRSLARFAANLGPIAWRVASKKISRTLPAGMKFGPGWVGENDAQPQQLQLQSTSPPGQLPSQSLPPLQVSSSMVSPRLMELKEDRPPENQEHSKNLPSNGLSSRFPANSALSSSEATNRSVVPTTEGVEAGRCLKQDSGLTLLNNGGSGAIRPRPPFQIHQGPILQPAMNGVRGGFGSNLAAQMGKVVRPARPSGSFGSETSMPSRSPPDMVSRTTNINNSGSDNNNKNNNNNNNTSNNNNNNVVHSAPVNHLQSDNTKLPVTGSSMNPSSISSSALVDSGDKTQEAATAPGSGLRPITTWRGLSLQQKPDTIPPDLNVRFQSPGSPNSSVRVESPQPDLALQL